VVTPQRPDGCEQRLGVEARLVDTNTVAPAFQGAKKQLQACLAQPGEEMFRCTCRAAARAKNMVDKPPTG